MASNLARPGTGKDIPKAEAQAKVIDLIQQGYQVKDAVQAVGRTEETYRDWRKKDPEFKASIDSIRSARTEEKQFGRPEVPDFDVFCRDWLGQPLFPHQLRMWDVIEGRPPRDMHDSMDYKAGYKNRVLINVPPEHGKSTTFTVNYVVWKIHKSPDVRIVIVSKSAPLAKDFLYEIKLKLTSRVYQDMHNRFAPEGGWKDPDGSWSTDRIYVQGKNDAGVQKDPTVQAMGLRGQIYGHRADLVILDDIVDTKNAHEVAFQLRMINRDIDSRLPSEQEGGGLLAVLGTRVAPMDIYRTLGEELDGDDRRVWSHLRMPAVLDYGNGDSATWETLWPEKWNGTSLSYKRRDNGWNLIYQQLDIDDEMTFRAEAVNASINGSRFPGPLTPEGMNHRPRGMEGLYVVGGLDPAASGNTAMIITGLDRESGVRYILDGWNKKNATAGEIIEKFKAFTEKYELNEWVIEQNALQRFIAQLPELQEFTRARGCRITPHTTNTNKRDADWGIETMAPLFDSCIVEDRDRPGRWKTSPYAQHMIELPSGRQNAWVNELVQQLTAWQPEGLTRATKTDLVMALWFTHIACTKIARRNRTKPTHLRSPYMTQRARQQQKVINLTALREEKRRQRELEGTA